ncbi:hypothetical protein ABVT39_001594 [Epinephelus coioides]
MSLRKQTPSDFLKQIIGRPVVVKLNSGVDYRGNAPDMNNLSTCCFHIVIFEVISYSLAHKLHMHGVFTGVLACLDGYMNIAIEQTEEYVNGQLKNKYGDAFLRGNNVLYISTQKRKV